MTRVMEPSPILVLGLIGLGIYVVILWFYYWRKWQERERQAMAAIAERVAKREQLEMEAIPEGMRINPNWKGGEGIDPMVVARIRGSFVKMQMDSGPSHKAVRKCRREKCGDDVCGDVFPDCAYYCSYHCGHDVDEEG